MSPSPQIANEIERLLRDPDALRPEWERMQRERGYDPQQPRVPAGNAKGGQWTSKGGSAVTNSYEHPHIKAAAAADPNLTNIAAGRLPIELVAASTKQRRFPNPIEFIDAARLALYNEWSERNGPNQQTIIEFRAAQYRRDTLDITRVAVLSRSEFGNRCPLLPEVQRLTDEATAEIRGSGIVMSPQQFGTAVHTLLKAKINKSPHPNLHPEVSFLKGKLEGYGVKDTVRIDVVESVNHDTVCFHDIKTGKSPLTFPRMLEMVMNAQKMHKGRIRNFIVTEVRPTQ